MRITIVLIYMMLCSVLNSNGQLKFSIERKVQTDKCIMGYLLLDDSAVCYTLELPYRGNINDISAIPVGEYNGTIRTDGKIGWRIELVKVFGNRQNIQIHVGNYTSDVHGCVLVGMGGSEKGCTVSGSKKALDLIQQKFVAYKKDLCLGCTASQLYPIVVSVK